MGERDYASATEQERYEAYDRAIDRQVAEVAAAIKRQRHATTIEAVYDGVQGMYQWRVTCVCGYASAWHLSPAPAERDATQHTGRTQEMRG